MKRFSTNLRHGFVLSVGMVFNSFLGLIFYILVARTLGPTGFGLFSFLLGVGMMVAEVTDFGFGSAIVKYGASGDLRMVLGAVVVQRGLTLALVMVLGVMAARISGQSLIFSVMVAISLSILAVVSQAFIASQRYGYYIWVNVFGNLVRLLLTAFLALKGGLTESSSLVIFSGANVLAFLAGFGVLGYLFRSFPVSFGGILVTARKMMKFSGYMGISLTLSSVAAKVDVPVVYALGGGAAAGIYSSGQKLSSVFPQIASALEGVFSPKFSSAKEFPENFRDYMVMVAVAAGGILLFVPWSGTVVSLVFGDKYLQAVPVFQYLLIGLGLFFLAGPFGAAVVYRHGRAQWQVLNSAILLVLTVVLYYLLVPRYGSLGAAVSFIIVSFSQLVLVTGEFWHLQSR